MEAGIYQKTAAGKTYLEINKSNILMPSFFLLNVLFIQVIYFMEEFM